MIAPWPGLEALPDSHYAAELRKEPGSRCFIAPVEAEYRRSSLLENRALVRLVCTLALLLFGLHAGEVLAGVAAAGSLVLSAVVLLSSAVLAWLAWSRGFERHYLPWAEVLVPLRNCLAAVQVTHVVVGGQIENLMVLPMLLIGPFYFLGLQYRVALTTAVLTVASMAAAAVVFHLPPPTALRGGALLIVSALTLGFAALRVERRSRRSFLETRIVAELAQQDALTWTKNRRVFDEYLPRLWRQAAGDARSLALLVIDVDHFKAYNDCYGHQAGDVVLRQVALAIQREVRRPLDLIARYGGEEFGVILYDADRAGARLTAERMRRAVEELAIRHRESPSGAILTISVGVAVVAPTAERNASGALQLADEALYRAKAKGRNRVELLDEGAHRLLDTGVFTKEEFAPLGCAGN